ncbi:MAG: DUF1616 domain-containing protein [Dehalococcoidia bacterium]|nr:MAG: DUF1616 domain-containing protein [Dehalococcoidia bacterium]
MKRFLTTPLVRQCHLPHAQHRRHVPLRLLPLVHRYADRHACSGHASSPSSTARTILGLPFLLLFPGYALQAALFPKKGSLGGWNEWL